MNFGLRRSEGNMKKIIIGIVVGFALATTISLAEQATEKGGGMGRMMQGMMGEQKSGEGSSMQTMMGMMMKMMEQCSQMMGGMGGIMGSKPEPKKAEPTK
jgi:hypothetical protein